MRIRSEVRFFGAVGLTALYGGLGGMIIAGAPFGGCGLLSGPLLAMPVGIPAAAICARWRLSVLLVATMQGIGAVCLGLLFSAEIERSLALRWPLLGQLMGATLGCVLAIPFRASEWLDGACPQCGYNLTGNVSGKCPECGSPVPETLVQPDESPQPDSKAGPRHEQGEPES